MALEETQVQPVWPENYPYSPQDMIVSYFAESDILTVHLSGKREPAISVPSDAETFEGFYWRVEPQQHRIVGFEIHNFVDHFVELYPESLVFAEIADLPEQELKRIRARIQGDYRKHEAVSLIFASMSRSLRPARAS